MNDQPRVLPPNFLEICERRARKAVCASTWNDRTNREEIVGFHFNPMIADWPICQQAEAEGWAKELRAALIHSVRQQMFLGQDLDVAKAIPPDWWVRAARNNAERYRMAAAARGDAKGGFNFSALTKRSRAMTGEQPE